MDSPSQVEGLLLVAPMLEGAPSAPAMGEEEDLGKTPARSTRAPLRKVCLLWQIIVFSIYGRIACVLINKIVWIGSLVVMFGSLIQQFGSLIQEFGSLIQQSSDQ